MTSSSEIRSKLEKIIFDADTLAGKVYDIILLIIVTLSVANVMLDSIASINSHYGKLLNICEWLFTFVFSLDYIIRLICVRNRVRYALSFFGVIDLLACLPTFLNLIWAGSHYLVAIRFLRILRMFRVLKLATYIDEARTLGLALQASAKKIIVFIFTVLSLVVVLGSLMYVIEGGENGFTSIPRSIYWAIVTLTTVGYGDISPHTNLGQLFAAMIMILGYSIIAVPTSIVTIAMSQTKSKPTHETITCKACGLTGHDHDAIFCKNCGNKLN